MLMMRCRSGAVKVPGGGSPVRIWNNQEKLHGSPNNPR
jgi:hypothetical protein